MDASNKGNHWFVRQFDDSPDLFVLADPESGRILDVNRTSDLLGYSRDELLESSLLDILQGYSLEQLASDVELVVEEGFTTFEWDLFCRDGTVIPTEMQLCLINAGSRPVLYGRAKVGEKGSTENSEHYAINRIAQTISSTLDIHTVYDTVAVLLRDLIQFDRLVISLISEDRSVLEPRYVHGLRLPGVEPGDTVSLETWGLRDLVEKRKPFRTSARKTREMARNDPTSSAAVSAGLLTELTVPLIASDRLVALMSLRSKSPNSYTDDDEGLVVRIARRIAPAVANSVRLTAATKEVEEREALAEAGRILSTTDDPDQSYEAFTEQLHRLIAFDLLSILLVDPDSDELQVRFVSESAILGFSPGEAHPIPGELVGAMFGDRTSYRVSGESPRTLCENMNVQASSARVAIEGLGARSLLMTPLVSHGNPIGVLALWMRAKDGFTVQEADTAEAFSVHLAGAVIATRLLEDSCRDALEQDVMADIGTVINSSLEIEDVYEAFAKRLKDILPLDRLTVATIDPSKELIRTEFVDGFPLPGYAAGSSTSLSNHHIESPAEDHDPILLTPEDMILGGNATPFQRVMSANFRSGLIAPLVYRDQVIGRLNVWKRTLPPYGP